MSRWTTSSANLRPMRRFTANRVLCGLVTAWRLAGWPTMTSLSRVKATTEGVVRSPSAFSITRGLPLSMMATHELVVPRSMPMILAMYLTPKILYLGPSRHALSGYKAARFKPCRSTRRPRHNDPRRPQQAPGNFKTRLYHLQYRVGFCRARLLGHYRFMPCRVEGLAGRIDLADVQPLEGLDQQLQGGLLAFDQTLGIRLRRHADGALEAVEYRQQLDGELLQSVTAGVLHLALRALADVVHLGGGP